ncbi:MAG: hypothetical protein J0M04_15165 [Verrucomicrobia bacterium]|nr:hypothetical protein [Verrucomicrobiota bacterium]
MFTSRLIGCFRLAAVILLAVTVALTGVAGDGPLWWLGVAGVLLLAAAVAEMVRGAGAFDERAFHRTRPGGERRVFLRQTVWLLVVPLAVGLVAVARGWWWNLGWSGSLTVGGVVFVLLLLCSVAVATGVVLGTGRSRRKFVVAWLMLGVPVAVYVWQAEMGHWQSAPLPLRFALWTSRFDSGVTIATGGFCLAWWMAAGYRRWKVALAVATAAGLCVPMLEYRANAAKPAATRRVLEERVPSDVTIRRTPLNQIAARKGGAKVPWNWLDVSGVREDEILRLYVNVDVQDGGGANLGRSGDYFGGSVFFSGRVGIRALSGISEAQCGLLPGERISKVSPKSLWVSGMHEIDHGDFGNLKRGDWRIYWEIVRPAYAGSVPLAAGGRLELPAGGVFKVDPVRQHASGFEIKTFEICATDDSLGSSTPWMWPTRLKLGVILVSGNGRKAVVLSSMHVGAGLVVEGTGLGTRWIRSTIDFRWRSRDGQPVGSIENGELEPEDLQGARIHVLDMRPGREEGKVVLPAVEP